jgi:hypothetical protein
LVTPEHLPELRQQRRPLLQLRRILRPPDAPLRANAPEVKAQKPERLSSRRSPSGCARTRTRSSGWPRGLGSGWTRRSRSWPRGPPSRRSFPRSAGIFDPALHLPIAELALVARHDCAPRLQTAWGPGHVPRHPSVADPASRHSIV